MKKQSILAICLALGMVFTLCACNNTEEPGTSASTSPKELTASEIAAKTQQALTATPITKLETQMDTAMSMGAGQEDKIDIVMKNKTETTVNHEPVAGYSLATVDMNISGQESQSVVESYFVNENNEMISYMNSSGIWMKVPTGQSPESYAQSAASVGIDTTNLTIDESVTTWNGKNVITLNFELTGDHLQSTVDTILSGMGSLGESFGSSADLFGSIDYTELSCKSVIYLDPTTYLPIYMEQTLDGMTEVMAPLAEQLGVTVAVQTCKTSASFTSFDAQSEITLPDGVAEKAEAWTRLLANEPDNGDGTFTIREGMALIDIVHPDGFEVADKDYDHVSFKRDDYRQITYTMSYITGETTPGSGEYFIKENDDSENRWTTMGGGKVEREQMPVATSTLEFTCDLLATTWETGRQDANFYAWTPLANDGTGTYYLYVEITDGYNDGLGFSKNADITSDEFVAYLNAASPSKLTSE